MTSGLWAQDEESIEEIKSQLVELKKILEAQSKQIDHMAGLLSQLKATPPVRNLTPPVPDKPKLLSMKKKRIEIGGELEVEFKTSERDQHPDVAGLFDGGHRQSFDMDKADIYLKAYWNEALWSFFEIEFTESDAIIDAAWAQIDYLKNDQNSFFIRTGLDHQFTKYSRTTETYPISGAAFWRDEFSQVRLHGKHSFGRDQKWLYWDAMLGNSYNVDNTDSALSENFIKANEIVQDDNDFERDSDGHLQ